MPVVTCLTVQDTNNVFGAEAISASLIKQQLDCLAGDAPIHAIKTGAMGNAAIVEILADFVKQRPDVPLITDPVIKAAGGGDLADDELISAMKEHLFPLAEIITPNGIELAMLGDNSDSAQAAASLLESGCASVLATGGHGTGPHIINTLYSRTAEPSQWEIERMGGEYHGTGCTLAAAISAGRASGLSQQAAISQAQNYVRHAIKHALEVGKGQPVPDRGIPWQP
jgi:hydroxymethylpyrimidine/phosphomethylpyrimidine kinase